MKKDNGRRARRECMLVHTVNMHMQMGWIIIMFTYFSYVSNISNYLLRAQ